MHTPTTTRRALAALALTLLAAVATVDRTAASTPSPEAAGGWRQVSAGGFHTCGVHATGRLYCWGWDGDGQLGDGPGAGDQAAPAEVYGGRTDWVAVAAGTYHTCGLRRSGRLFCWGDDSAGQLGNGAASGDRFRPVEVAGRSRNWQAVALGLFHTCGLRRSGRLLCWGNDADGQLGDGAAVSHRQAPVRVAGPLDNWVAVDAGASHTCARNRSGVVSCWGSDGEEQLGNGPVFGSSRTPAPLTTGVRRWAGLSAGEAHACARAGNGRLWCWGGDASGQLGNGAPAETATKPGPVDASRDWVGVSTGLAHTCGRRSNGTLACWGADANGQLGDGPGGAGSLSPVPVAGTASWASISAGGFHACALTTARGLRCWGDNSKGQVGASPSTAVHPAPVVVRAPAVTV